ncbi:surfactin synthase thioesterase subunit [Allocatelliglobosispora scoriae]|uniref:Surfactin synthase thioesterase subunit n=1 Tax=Allocatelliglobosispora scoriae TaxID=643052 RepID=A0A841BVW1_9ACTN|nr:thioesterase domain-containing protein [Allocatelliglobosispora scoriae]MBB5873237.1 surfactin synthase thioesterase subunit [Allocatelliglobosispora scoriae]
MPLREPTDARPHPGGADPLFPNATRHDAEVILFCLPFAGGGASAFRSWRQAFPAAVDLQPIQLAGRETRIAEPLRIDAEEIAAAIARRIDRPYAIYGHSMGARLGFEVIRALRALGSPMPLRFYVGAARPPDLTEPIVRIADRPDDGFVEGLEQLGGVPAGVMDVPELRELLLPMLRADFRWIDDYRYTPGEPLPVRIVGFGGLADASVPPDLMRGWAAHTSVGFQLRRTAGGHFFLHSEAPTVTALITTDLLGAVHEQDDLADAEAAETPVPVDTTNDPGGTDHHIPLPGTEWSVWRSALLRTTGFPADGLHRLAAPELAAVADAHLGGGADGEAYARAYAEAVARVSAEVWAITGDPLFREAVTWQNRTAMHAVDGVRNQGAVAPRNSKRRQREETIAQYWQRYCAKNETIGFFGPVKWITLDPDGPAVTARPGPGLISGRRVFLEHWALSAFAAAITSEPRVRQWLRPSLHAQLSLRGRQLLRPAHAPVSLTAAEASLLSRCDGRRPAIEIARSAANDPDSPLRNSDDALILLGQLADRELIRWDLDLPMRLHAEESLAEQLGAIGDPSIRAELLASYATLRAAREAVGAAAGDAEALKEALDALDRIFVELTGRDAQRRSGEMYAGRTLCVEECDRDLELSFGAPVLTAIAAPLAIMLQAARWLTVATADAYLAVLRELYDDLAREHGSADVPFGQFWYLAQGTLFGTVDRPIDAVTDEFTRRWAQLFRLDRFGPETHEVTLASADLADIVKDVFPAERPAWAAARMHSPDLHICAESVEAIERGDFTVVLGELHTALTTLDSELFLLWAPNRPELAAAMLADAGPERVLPLYPLSWPRNTPRLGAGLHNDSDVQLGIAPAPGADPDRLLPVTALTLSEKDGDLFVHAGRHRWPLIELFAEVITNAHTQGSFKLVASTGHAPRITVDRMVVARETWRTTLAETGLADAKGEEQQYLAARRWRAALGLPDQVFVSVATETKPTYVDLTSPTYISALCALLRGTRTAHGDRVRITVSEMLPGTDQAWVPDSAGRGYFSELRIQVRDPHSSLTARAPQSMSKEPGR